VFIILDFVLQVRKSYINYPFGKAKSVTRSPDENLRVCKFQKFSGKRETAILRRDTAFYDTISVMEKSRS